MSNYLSCLSVLLSVSCGTIACGAESNPSIAQPEARPSTSSPTITDPSYHLSSGDTIAIAVQGEQDMSAVQTIGRSGEIRLVYVTNDVQITGKTVRDAERFLENLYRDKKVLKNPVVTLTITAYSPREVSVLGAVRNPGTVPFPRDFTSMDLVEVITRAGGFIPISKQDAVTVTHRGADNKETIQTIDLENVISGRRRQGKDRAEVLIYPGDRIYVPERIF
jgi:polysaccharide export outer membrane protein